jgi:Flp pilus assembly protein TadG
MKSTKVTTAWFEHMKRTRRCNSRGAAMVEFALVLIPLCLIIFGLVEFGFIYRASLDVSSASRAGARIGAAEPKADTFYADIFNAAITAGNNIGFSNGDFICVYQVNNSVNPNGTPTGSCASNPNARMITYNGSSWSPAITSINDASGPWSKTARQDCLSSTNPDSVGVEVSVTHHSITGFFGNFNNMRLTEHTVMRLEPPENDSSCS